LGMNTSCLKIASKPALTRPCLGMVSLVSITVLYLERSTLTGSVIQSGILMTAFQTTETKSTPRLLLNKPMD